MIAVRYPRVYTAELLRLINARRNRTFRISTSQCATGIQPESLMGVVEGDEEDQDEAAGSNAAEIKY